MHSCYIIDDDKHAVEALTQYADKIPGLNVIGGDTNPLAALEAITKGSKPDIVFLDVQMPELSGLAVADILGKDTAIVFTTAYGKYAIDAFGKNVVDFLLKPISFEKFARSVSKVQRLLSENIQDQKGRNSLYIGLEAENSFIQVKMADILYILEKGEEITIHTTTDAHTAKVSLAHVMVELPGAKFAQPASGIIVNLDAVKTFTNNEVAFPDVTFTIDSTFKEVFLKKADAARKARN